MFQESETTFCSLSSRNKLGKYSSFLAFLCISLLHYVPFSQEGILKSDFKITTNTCYWYLTFVNVSCLRKNILHHVDVSCLSCILQAGILAVGRGNKVVEPVVGSDGKMIYGYYIWVLYSAIIF